MAQTGPLTAAGKAKVSRNAVKHGLLSDEPVIDGVEDRRDWERHRQGIIDSLAPEGYLETHLAERVASLLWRLGRVVRYETEMLSTGLDYDYEAETIAIISGTDIPSEVIAQHSPRKTRQFIAARLIPGALTGPPTQRYEAHLHRQWLQTQHELEAMQARRRGESTPLARLDVISAPNGS
jgi:hypothetical protein